MPNAVVVEALSKRYTLGKGGGYRRLTEVLSDALRRGKDRDDRTLWALRDVSFEVAEGEVIGIVGRNGAGKSTLLKILSRITEPTSGRVELRGRVGSLLEVGTGFHPELTGRENIYLNGAVLGMRRSEIARRFEEIVAFAEVERFLDTPVKRYSSGMYVRLAFAVAAHLEPEILVVDEVLAVGDAAFQKKCLGKMSDVARSGRTVLFVSHNMAAVQSLCTRGVLLDGGHVVVDASATETVARHLEHSHAVSRTDLSARRDRVGTGRVRVTGLRLRVDGAPAAALVCGASGEILLDYESDGSSPTVQASIGAFSSTGEGAVYLGSEMTGSALELDRPRGSIRCQLDPVSLLPGQYILNLHIAIGGEIADWVQEAAIVQVDEGDFFGTGRLPPSGYGFVATPHRWSGSAE